MIRINKKNIKLILAVLVIILAVACSKGYNKYADEFYAEGMAFYEHMEYDRSIDSFAKVSSTPNGG